MSHIPPKFGIQQRTFIVETYIKCKSIKQTKQQFSIKYSNIKNPSKGTILKLAKFFSKTGSVVDASRSGRPSLVEQRINSINEKIIENPRTSLRKISQQTTIPLGSAHNIVRKELCYQTKYY